MSHPAPPKPPPTKRAGLTPNARKLKIRGPNEGLTRLRPRVGQYSLGGRPIHPGTLRRRCRDDDDFQEHERGIAQEAWLREMGIAPETYASREAFQADARLFVDVMPSDDFLVSNWGPYSPLHDYRYAIRLKFKTLSKDVDWENRQGLAFDGLAKLWRRVVKADEETYEDSAELIREYGYESTHSQQQQADEANEDQTPANPTALDYRQACAYRTWLAGKGWTEEERLRLQAYAPAPDPDDAVGALDPAHYDPPTLKEIELYEPPAVWRHKQPPSLDMPARDDPDLPPAFRKLVLAALARRDCSSQAELDEKVKEAQQRYLDQPDPWMQGLDEVGTDKRNERRLKGRGMPRMGADILHRMDPSLDLGTWRGLLLEHANLSVVGPDAAPRPAPVPAGEEGDPVLRVEEL